MQQGFILIEKIKFGKESIKGIEESSYQQLSVKIMEALRICSSPEDVIKVLKTGINLFKKKGELIEGNNILNSITEE